VSDAPGNGRWAKWQVFLTAFGGVTVVGAAIIGFLLQSGATANTVSQQATAISDMRAQIGALMGQQAQDHTELVAMREKLTEVETQFCASDIVRNLMHAADLRETAMLWHKTFGETLPTDNAYYPTICNRDVQAPR